jgi:hypothetical protein
MRPFISPLLVLFVALTVTALTDRELANCFNTIADHLSLGENVTLEAAHTLNQAGESVFEMFCNSTLQAIGQYSRRFLRSSGDHFAGAQADHQSQRILQVMLFPPAYPESSEVGVLYGENGFTGNVFDRLEDGITNRCSGRREAQDIVNFIIASTADAGAQAVCGGDPTGLTCVGAGITAATLVLWDLNVQGCSFHDGNVDSAEIEATYENLLGLISVEQIHFTSVSSLVRQESTNIQTAATMDAAETRATVRQESTSIQAAVNNGVRDIQNLINSQFDALNKRLDTLDETLRIIRRLLLTPLASRPGYDDKDSRCDCTIPTPGFRLPFLSQYCDESDSCPVPNKFP